jgi:uncharacterized protein YecE (DUF72 family)
MTPSEVFIGTSGYSFADWVGPFYPMGMRSADFLAYYATQFHCVEVNSTYYGIPEPRVLASMEKRTPEDFRFIVKLNQAMTHEYSTEPALYGKFRAVLEPLKAAGKYHGLLAQFPWAFRRDAHGKAHLERLRGLLPDEPLWVEFRHDSWMHPKLAAWLGERSLGYCIVDEPALPGLVPPVLHVTNGIGYVRFHGRNAQHWWGSGRRDGAGSVRETAAPGAPARGRGDQLRYDYNYSERELTEWVAKLNELAKQAKQTYLFFNNCHAGQAARNAKLMEELLRRSNPLL